MHGVGTGDPVKRGVGRLFGQQTQTNRRNDSVTASRQHRSTRRNNNYSFASRLSDVIGHENQSQHYPSVFMFRVFRTDCHARRIFIPHRPTCTSGQSFIEHGHSTETMENSSNITSAKRIPKVPV